jgi:hypothetical protein
MQQQLSMPPAIIVQRFCNIAAETLSSQEHITFMPPGHFVNVMVHRGTIIMFMPGAAGAWVLIIPVVPGIGMLDIGIPGIAVPERSIIFVVAIVVSFNAGSVLLPSATFRRKHLYCGDVPAGFQVRECEFQAGEHGQGDQLADLSQVDKDWIFGLD